MVYNHTDLGIEVQPQDIQVEVCPMQEITLSEDVFETISEGRVHSQVHASAKEDKIDRPEHFPEELWGLVSPSDRRKAALEFPRFPEARLKQCIEDIFTIYQCMRIGGLWSITPGLVTLDLVRSIMRGKIIYRFRE